MKQLLFTLILTALSVCVFAAAPEVSNVVATPAAGMVTISYTLTADSGCTITLLVSTDNGSNYLDIPLTALSGAVGNGVTAGNGKQIIWHPAGDAMGVGSTYKLKVIARDNPSPTAMDDFILVESGSFNNGTSNVSLSSFYIDKYEITQREYQAVMGVNPSRFTGVTNGPVEQVSWFNAIEYCNRRSLQTGLTPCYSYSTYGSNPDNWPAGWNTINTNHTDVSCNWTATGYRLPTEMEWEYVARGGNQTHNYTYSGSNDLNAVGWYSSNSAGSHHTIGTKAANELGTFDLTGNIFEWVWDIYGGYPSGAQTDPHGSTSGTKRMRRGGSWNGSADFCPVSTRVTSYATYSIYYVGFRCLRVYP
jgi:formylglycine-generating enzyme required for sulfatase activity